MNDRCGYLNFDRVITLVALPTAFITCAYSLLVMTNTTDDHILLRPSQVRYLRKAFELNVHL